jgi:hypothetical protein
MLGACGSGVSGCEPAKAAEVAGGTDRAILHRPKISAADPFHPLLEPRRKGFALPVVISKDMPAAFVPFEIVNRELHRLKPKPLRGGGVEPELVDVNVGRRPIFGGLEVDELDAPVPPVPSQHEIDAAVDASVAQGHFEGDLGADGAAELVAVLA